MEKIKTLVLNTLERDEVFLDRLELKDKGKKPKLIVFIDKEGGVSLKDCERVSKRLSAALDVADLIPYSYTLDVSSPGLDRPLTGEEDYRRFEGRLALLHLKERIDGIMQVRGKIGAVQDGRVVIKTEDRDYSIPVALISMGRLDFDFEEY